MSSLWWHRLLKLLTLLRTNISYQKATLKMIFLSQWLDMSFPWGEMFYRFEWHFVQLHPHDPSPCQHNVCAMSFWQELTTSVRSRRSKQKVHRQRQNPRLVGMVKDCMYVSLICIDLQIYIKLLCTHLYLK